jgi:N-acetylglutamate synthase-like GNAT family acetyltransferase
VTSPQVPIKPKPSNWDDGSDPNAGQNCKNDPIRLVRHGRLNLILLLRIGQVQALFNANSFWGVGRSRSALMRMLLGSCVVVSAWQAGRLVGLGRATSDGVFRAVLWDVVVAGEQQGQGLGRRIVNSLLAHPAVAKAERVYLMTTNSSGFYEKMGFKIQHGQQLLVLYRKP